MKKINKVLAIALVMALCISSELGATKRLWYVDRNPSSSTYGKRAFMDIAELTSVPTPTDLPASYANFKDIPVVIAVGDMLYGRNDKEMRFNPFNQPAAHLKPVETGFPAWWAEGAIYAEDTNPANNPGSYPVGVEALLKEKQEQLLKPVLDEARDLDLAVKLEWNTSLKTILTSLAQHKAALERRYGIVTEGKAAAKIKEEVAQLEAFMGKIAEYQRLSQNVTDLEQAIAAHKKTDNSALTYASELERLTAALKAETEALEAQRAAMKLKAGFDLESAATKLTTRLHGKAKRSLYKAYRKAAQELAEATQQLEQQKKDLEQITDKLKPVSTAGSSASSGTSVSEEQRRDLEQKRSDLVVTTADLRTKTQDLKDTVDGLAQALGAEGKLPKTPVKKLAFDVALTERAAKLREQAKAMRAFKDAADRAEAIEFAEGELARLGRVIEELEKQLRMISSADSERSAQLTKQRDALAAKGRSLNEALIEVTPRASVPVSTESGSSAAPTTDKFAKLDALVEAEALRLEAKATKHEDAVKQAKAAADAKASWSWKQIVGFNVATIVLANMFENMLEGWVGSNIKGKDKRTTKQKAIDMAKALISLEMYKANFVELGRVFAPAKPAEGETTPSFGKRTVSFVKRKPFIAAGAVTWVAGNGYMAFTGLTAKNLKAKYFPAKAA